MRTVTEGSCARQSRAEVRAGDSVRGQRVQHAFGETVRTEQALGSARGGHPGPRAARRVAPDTAYGAAFGVGLDTLLLVAALVGGSMSIVALADAQSQDGAEQGIVKTAPASEATGWGTEPTARTASRTDPATDPTTVTSAASPGRR